ncbi:hypothetical protein MO867_22360 [Microbulbifer sp. OS29]|uniref:Spore coat protein U (SCPU) domain-containing protein n=1 Tax=Microbulbifer okhotskensis TaxID=2926617 RepID=A0A9X2ET83_9GAMM|nr:hypothetical protein [Microbulbifer okhotskensis]MCO1337070.1 hypothetical protein [Microbulbifer okhotskensis]
MKMICGKTVRTVLVVSIAASFVWISWSAQADGDVECGDIITTAVVFDQDLVCGVTLGLTMTGPVGSLDLNGCSVIYNETVVGILLDGTSAQLSGGSTGWFYFQL